MAMSDVKAAGADQEHLRFMRLRSSYAARRSLTIGKLPPESTMKIYDLVVELLRPVGWLAARGAKTGGTVELNLPEMGVCGHWAFARLKTQASLPCPDLNGPN